MLHYSTNFYWMCF